MKYYFIYRFLIVLLLCALLGCGDNVGPFANYVSFEIDGVFWESNQANAIGSIAGGGLISINMEAVNEAGEAFELRIFSTDQNAIEYVFDQNTSIGYTATGNLNSSQVYRSNNCTTFSGGIIFSERNLSFVSGTFRGTVCLPSGEVKQIRNGFFNQVFL